MARHRSHHRSTRTILPAFPTNGTASRRTRHSRATYRRPFSIQQQRQPHAIGHRARQRIRQRSARQHIRRHRIDNTYRAALRPHWVDGRPGEFWWRLY